MSSGARPVGGSAGARITSRCWLSASESVPLMRSTVVAAKSRARTGASAMRRPTSPIACSEASTKLCCTIGRSRGRQVGLDHHGRHRTGAEGRGGGTGVAAGSSRFAKSYDGAISRMRRLRAGGIRMRVGVAGERRGPRQRKSAPPTAGTPPDRSVVVARRPLWSNQNSRVEFRALGGRGEHRPDARARRPRQRRARQATPSRAACARPDARHGTRAGELTGPRPNASAPNRKSASSPQSVRLVSRACRLFVDEWREIFVAGPGFFIANCGAASRVANGPRGPRPPSARAFDTAGVRATNRKGTKRRNDREEGGNDHGGPDDDAERRRNLGAHRPAAADQDRLGGDPAAQRRHVLRTLRSAVHRLYRADAGQSRRACADELELPWPQRRRRLHRRAVHRAVHRHDCLRLPRRPLRPAKDLRRLADLVHARQSHGRAAERRVRPRPVAVDLRASGSASRW